MTTVRTRTPLARGFPLPKNAAQTVIVAAAWAGIASPIAGQVTKNPSCYDPPKKIFESHLDNKTHGMSGRGCGNRTIRMIRA